MKIYISFVAVLILSVVFVTEVAAQRTGPEIVPPKGYRSPTMDRSDKLQRLLDSAVGSAFTKYSTAGFKDDEIAATLIDVSEPGKFYLAERRGNERIYPASVVKMFYMAALHRQIEDGKITPSPELLRGLKDMIVDSSNEATQYILDVLTDTSSGAELSPVDFKIWQHKRNRVNRFFAAMNYSNINVNQKTFCEDAYGVEQQTRNYKGQNRNMLTTNATAQLLAEIVTGRMGSPDSTAKMMALLKRDPFAETKDPDGQAHAFSGIALRERDLKQARLWSKAGWTSTTRHDAAYFELPNGRKFVLAVFTEKHANERGFIPEVAGRVIDAMSQPNTTGRRLPRSAATGCGTVGRDYC